MSRRGSRKLEPGAIGATLLAMAGLKRLGLAHRARAALSLETFLPAVGQGAIGLPPEERRPRERGAGAIEEPTGFAALAVERIFLKVLDGSCRTPIAGLGRVTAGRLRFRGEVLRTDGSERFDIEAEGGVADAVELGAAAGRTLKARLPTGVLADKV